MKKILLALLAVVQIGLATSSAGIVFKEGNFYYEIISEEDKTCEVSESPYFEEWSNPDFYPEDIVIPETVNGYRVIGIGHSAFGSYYFKIKTVNLPNSIVYIESCAFRNCPELVKINLNDNITRIGSDAFIWCRSLSEIHIPQNITIIENYCFYNCEKLSQITFPKNLTKIGDYAFGTCSGITDLQLPNSVTVIGHGAFEGCGNMKTISGLYNIASIGSHAFRYTALETCILGKNLKSVDGGMFGDCKNLKSVYILNPEPPESDFDPHGDILLPDGSPAKSPAGEGSGPNYEINNLAGIYNATLYVPEGSIDAYKEANYWKYFKEIKEFDPSGVNAINREKTTSPVIYDINGYRQSFPTRGIKIINGRKTMVR